MFQHGTHRPAFTIPPRLADIEAMAERALGAIPARLRGAHAENSEALAPIVAEALRPGDAVLVKGSLGSRMKVIVDAIEAISVVEKRVNS